MPSNDIQSDMSSLVSLTLSYYERRGRQCAAVGTKLDEGKYFSVDFLIDRKFVIRYEMPIDKRNHLAGVLIGIGPSFVHPIHLMSYDEANRYSVGDSHESVLKNLALVDEHLASRVLQLFSLTGQQ